MATRSDPGRPDDREHDWGLPPVPPRRVPLGTAGETGPGAVGEFSSGVEEPPLTATAHRRRWLGLLVLASSQLLIVVDGTIMNVALPALSDDLDLAAADRQWVITAYTLAFGGLLLLCGRIADYLGFRRALTIGLVGFAAASAVGGAAQNLETLIVARAAQGAFGALLAPAALALVSTTFTDVRERARAFAIFGVVAGGGSAIGLIAGGMLTEYANWRWTMYVNVPLAALSVLGAYLFLDEIRGDHPGRLDAIGTVLATGGLLAVVYSFSEAERNGWTETLTLVLIGVGLSLLILFVLSQNMVPNPLLPLRVLGDRTRAGSNLAITLAALSMIGAFFFLTFYLQGVLGFGPVKTGVAFLPVTGGVIVASGVISGLMSKVAPRVLMGGGLVGSAVALFLMAQMSADSDYLTDLLPALMLMGIAMGAIFVPAFNAATHGVDPRDAGVAGAVVNATQQIGASLGVALLSTIAANRTADYLSGRSMDPDTLITAQVEGYARASLVAGLILAVAAIAVVLMVNVHRLTAHPGLGEVPIPGAVAEPTVAALPTYAPADPEAASARVPAVFSEATHVTEPSYGGASNGDAAPHPVPAPAHSGAAPVDGPAHSVAAPAHSVAAPVDGPAHSVAAPVHPGPAHPVAAPVHPGPAHPVAAPVHPGAQVVPTAADGSSAAGSAAVAEEPADPAAGPPLRVQLRRPDGRAVAAASVTLLDSSGRQVSRAESSPDGIAEFAAVGGGEFLLVVRHEGCLPQARTVLLPSPPAPTVEVEIPLTGAARLSGIVTNTAGRPVEGALVTLTGVDGAVAGGARTDATGAYELVDLTVEEGTLAVFAPAARPVAVPVSIPPGGRVSRDVEVRGSAVVSGIAQTPEGWLIADARVSLHADGVEIAVTRTDADGAYSFSGLEAGTYTVIAVGYPPAQTEVVAGSGETTAAPITLAHES